MYSDQDIKIVGDRPSEDVRRNKQMKEEQCVQTPTDHQSANLLGERVAALFIEDAKNAEQNDTNGNSEMMIQRRLLLAFTATIGFEQYCKSDTLGGIAQKKFLKTLKTADAELYRTSSDTGAFSFYYLAFRRGTEVERRIGQTFAMLCSHDGDPIFQELGEAIYCWFAAEIRKVAEELNLY